MMQVTQKELRNMAGKPYFATAPRSFPACQPDRAKKYYTELCERYPESEGFTVSVTQWECIGHSVTLQWIKEGH